MTLTVFLCLRFAVIDGDMQLFWGNFVDICPSPRPAPKGEGASTALWLGFGGDL